jgi:hypothetical protein
MHPKGEAEMSRCVLLFSSLVAAAMHGKRSCNYFLRPSLPNSLFSMVRQRDLSCPALLIGRVPSAPQGLLFFLGGRTSTMRFQRSLASDLGFE